MVDLLDEENEELFKKKTGKGLTEVVKDAQEGDVLLPKWIEDGEAVFLFGSFIDEAIDFFKEYKQRAKVVKRNIEGLSRTIMLPKATVRVDVDSAMERITRELAMAEIRQHLAKSGGGTAGGKFQVKLC